MLLARLTASARAIPQSIFKRPTRGIFHVSVSEDHVRVVQEKLLLLVV